MRISPPQFPHALFAIVYFLLYVVAFFIFYCWYCAHIIPLNFKSSLFSDRCWTELVLLHHHVWNYCDIENFSCTICKFVYDSSPYKISPSLLLQSNFKLKFDWTPYSSSCVKYTNLRITLFRIHHPRSCRVVDSVVLVTLQPWDLVEVVSSGVEFKNTNSLCFRIFIPCFIKIQWKRPPWNRRRSPRTWIKV